ncbi:MAG: threonine synthase [Alphaproteobacteria bacterium]
MHYISTRGHAPEIDFATAATTGLAADGGLYVPKTWPQFSEREIGSWRGQPYRVIAQHVLGALVGDALPRHELQQLIDKSLAHFSDPDITPLRQLDERIWVMELFHGPTLAFKDLALQFLGQLFDYLLGKNGRRATVVGATSGDTGSAAIAGCAGCSNLDVFILYPHNRPSEIQRRQMTTVATPNVHAIAIEGSFDDCQAIVKGMFNNAALRAEMNLMAVNSINWARIAAQIVYYFYAATRLGGPTTAPSFVVPTGNFGNIYSAYAATQMGLPVAKLAAATNANNAVHRFFTTGAIVPTAAQPTLSPSMDIQVPSNLERLLFALTGQDGAILRAIMAASTLRVAPVALGQARQYYTSAAIDDAATLKEISQVYHDHSYLLDPHSAVGVAAARQLTKELPDPVVCLACAHPAKFPEAIIRAIGKKPDLLPSVAALYEKAERVTILPPDLEKVMAFVRGRRCAD